MSPLKTIICGLLVVSTCMALAQGEKDVQRRLAEIQAMNERFTELMRKGEELFNTSQYDKAAEAYLEAIRLHGDSRFFDNYLHYPLARALDLAGRSEEALVAYKRSISWDPVALELYVLHSNPVLVAMDYAILLAKNGMNEEAKALYYFGLSSFSQYGASREVLPFLVVFDPDPTMTVWEYSPEKLIAAATMAKVPHDFSNDRAAIEEAYRLEPNWIISAMYFGSYAMQLSETGFLKHVEGLAQTEQERNWIRATQTHLRLGIFASRMRLESKVLNKAKRDQGRIHDKIATSAIYPGGGNDPRVMNFGTPYSWAKDDKATSMTNRGELFHELGMYDEAIKLFSDVIQMYSSMRGYGGRGYHELALSLAAAGRNEEALATFRQTVFWDSEREELSDSSTADTGVKLDYAVLLAKSGKVEEAKMVYYSVLRTYNRSGSKTYEPYPFTIVFDPDPTMTVWEYTTDKFVAASLMLRSMNLQSASRSVSLAEEVRQMEPTWIVPLMVQARRADRRDRSPFLDKAMALAKTDEEREWIRQLYDDVPQLIGRNRRLASTLLNAAKRDLERNHHKIAVCECEGGHGG